MAADRLQKILARAGVASRRAAEDLIREGRVRVNGRIVRELGTRADAFADRIELDGKRLVAEKPVYFLLNKPREVVTTLDDPEGRATVAGLVKRVPERVFPVGRLDYHTSGALLLTNDGEMAQALLHPRRQVPKTYVVKVRGAVPLKTLEALRNGVEIGPGERTREAELFVLREERGNTWLSLTITEGKNRQVHRMFEAVGQRVQRLSRVAFAGLSIEGLPPGAYRPLNGDELRKLKRDYRNPARAKRSAAAPATAGPWGDDVAPGTGRARRGPPKRGRVSAGGPAKKRVAAPAEKRAARPAPAKKRAAAPKRKPPHRRRKRTQK